MSKIISIPYWEFHYKRDFNDVGSWFITFNENEVPSYCKYSLCKKHIHVPELIYFQKNFCPYEWYELMYKCGYAV